MVLEGHHLHSKPLLEHLHIFKQCFSFAAGGDDALDVLEHVDGPVNLDLLKFAEVRSVNLESLRRQIQGVQLLLGEFCKNSIVEFQSSHYFAAPVLSHIADGASVSHPVLQDQDRLPVAFTSLDSEEIVGVIHHTVLGSFVIFHIIVELFEQKLLPLLPLINVGISATRVCLEKILVPAIVIQALYHFAKLQVDYNGRFLFDIIAHQLQILHGIAVEIHSLLQFASCMEVLYGCPSMELIDDVFLLFSKVLALDFFHDLLIFPAVSNMSCLLVTRNEYIAPNTSVLNKFQRMLLECKYILIVFFLYLLHCQKAIILMSDNLQVDETLEAIAALHYFLWALRFMRVQFSFGKLCMAMIAFEKLQFLWYA